jgi:hypothetical protein
VTTTATFVRDVHNDGPASHKLWHVDPPIPDYEGNPTSYVITSAVNASGYDSGPETLIFAADADGNIKDFMDLEGSYRGELNHERAIREAGWKMQGVE